MKQNGYWDLGWDRVIRLVIGLVFIMMGWGEVGAEYHPLRIPVTHITVIIDDNYPPYIFRDENGVLHGIRVDYWKLWELKTGIKVRLWATDLDKSLQMMAEERGDVLDMVFHTRERATKYLYSKPYARIDVGIFMHRTLSGITDVNTLRGFTIGVKSGDACIEVLNRNGITNLREYRSYKAIIEAARGGEIRVFCVDNPPAFYYLYKLNLENEFTHAFDLYFGEFHYVVNPRHPELLKTVDQGFEHFNPEEINRIHHKWQGRPIFSDARIHYVIYSLLIILVVVIVLLLLNLLLRRKVRIKTLALEIAMKNLGDSEERYRTIFENTMEGIFQISPEGRVLRANPALVGLMGFSSFQQMEQSRWIMSSDWWVDSSDWPRFQSRHVPDGQVHDFRVQLQTQSGDWIWCSINSHAVRNESGELVYYEGTIDDINHQVEAERALRESQEYYSKLLITLPDLIIDVDLNGTILDCNNAALPMLGYTREALVGMSIYTFFSKEKYRYSILDFNHPFHDEAIPHEFHVTLDNGIDRFVEVNFSVLKDQYGNPFAVVNVCRDITHRKQIEEALRESEASYRGLFNTTREAIYIIDMDGRFVDVNPGAVAIYGYSKEEFIGRSWDFLSAPTKNDLNKLSIHIDGALAGESQQFEFWGLRKNGEEFPKSIKLFKGRYFGQDVIIVISEDISQRKKDEENRLRMERKLLHVQKLESLGVLAGGIAHDFNNILMAIMGHTDLALYLHPEEGDLAAKLSQIKQAARRGADLCHQMLDYAGKGKFIIQSIQLNDLVIEMVNLLKVSISKKVSLTLNLEPELPETAGDITQIRQILMNLITNASEAIGNLSGSISITTGSAVCHPDDFAHSVIADPMENGLYLFMEVSDNGCGMSQETMSRIFDPFFTTKFTGRGLGMPAVLGILKGHRGNIKITSRIGHGSRFTVYLPVSNCVAFTPAPDKPVLKPVPAGKGLILLVDDEEPVRTVCAEMLQHLGFEIMTAGDGEEALKIFRELTPRIGMVLLDLIMPRMDGEETFRHMIKIKPETRIIMFSGFTEQEISSRFKDQMPAGFIQKPFAMNQLADKVKMVWNQD